MRDIETKMVILLVEDDRNLADAIIEYLDLEDIECDYANNGVLALELLETNRYDVLILDINLPRMDGLEVCKNIREFGNDVPTIMLTAKDLLDDKLAGFWVGADDYLVKPFAMDELVARVRALSTRISRQVKKLIVGDLVLNLDLGVASRGGTELKLPPINLKLLERLMRASPKPVSSECLIDSVWGYEGADRNTLKVHIHKLRQELSPNHSAPLIHTVKLVGYALRCDHEN